MKQIVLTVVIIIATNILNAQNYKFGKVSNEELQEKFNPLDSSASATYLYKYRKTFFRYIQDEGFQLVTEIHERIKIYSPDGFDYATKEVNLYKSGGNKEKIIGLKAYTYNLINGKVEEIKLKKEAIFRTEVSDFRNETKFTMPNIKSGTVIEYKYTIDSPFIWNVDEFVLQHDIPIKKLEAKFEAPEYFNFKVNTKGYLHVAPVKEINREKIEFSNKSREGGQGWSSVKTTYSKSSLEFNEHIWKYSLSNIPALKDEPYVNNINNYRSSVKYELSFTKFPNSLTKYYSTTWEDVVKTIYESTNFGLQLNRSSYYEDDINTVIGGISDPVQKMALIFDFVKSKVKWNGFYGKYTNQGVKKAYKEQVGNVAEINLMLTSMLRYAGLNANPVLVSTRNNGVPLFPTREGYNYVISCVEVPNGVILLDATSRYSTANVLPFRVLNWQGRIIRKQGSSALIDLYPKANSVNKVSMMVSLDKNGNVEGQVRNVKTIHKALLYREKYLNADKEDFIVKLENSYGGMEISDFDVKNSTDLSKPIMESFKFVKESQADVIGNSIYFSPLFFLKTIENPFKLDKREFPVDFGYPSSTNYRVVINLPEGYKVEHSPESKAIKLPDNMGSFSYEIIVKDKFIQLVVNTHINGSVISSIYYEELKEYFKQLIEKENEKIVLIKI